MNHLRRFKRQIVTRSAICLLAPGLISLVVMVALIEVQKYDTYLSLAISLAVYGVLGLLAYLLVTPLLTDPIEKVWQAVWHISPNKKAVPAPKLETIKVGRELVSSLVLQIYELVHQGQDFAESTGTAKPQAVPSSGILDTIPTALFFMKDDNTITEANNAACKFIGLDKSKIVGKSIYDVLRMSFMGEDTLDEWLAGTKNNKVTDTKSWEHVKLTIEETKAEKQFDMSASYSKGSSSGNDLVISIFDRTDAYINQDKSTNYVAIAVHELRTPLTLLRGYIEVFEDELGDSLTPELKEFMRKMSASAQTLTAFVSNILNVARIDEDQLTLSLHEADWGATVTQITEDLRLRASVRSKSLELDIAPDLPKVAIDKISMYEVVSNLVDNAIKYSGQSPKIIIHVKLGKDGDIETEVQDFGHGIPSSAMEGLFTRYYRSHRSKNAISGSGLGLYLVKSIVTAHGGKVWVNSKEGEGTSFGFSIQKFDSLKNTGDNNQGIERQASGWIKNHSLYRR